MPAVVMARASAVVNTPIWSVVSEATCAVFKPAIWAVVMAFTSMVSMALI